MSGKEENPCSGRWPIPESWKWSVAGELADVIGGGTPKNAKEERNYANDGTPWVTPADLSGYKATYISRGERSLSKFGLDRSSAKILPAGTVLFTSRAPVGYCAIADNPIATNQGFKSFVLYNGMQPEFVRYYLLASKKYAESLSSGTTFLELSGARAKQLLLPVAPANEQSHIVAKLDELFSQIEKGEENLRRVQALVKQYRQSVLKAAVTGELTRDWRARQSTGGETGEQLLARILDARRAAWEAAEREKMKAKGKPPKDDKWKAKYKEPVAPDTTDLPDLPERWVWASLEQISWSSNYGTSSKCSYEGKHSPVLRIPNIRAGALQFDDLKYANTSLNLQKLDFLGVNDHLVIRTNGSRSLIGVGATILEAPSQSTYFASYLIRFRLVPSDGLAPWVNTFWQSDLVRKLIYENAATSAGQFNISQTNLLKFPIPLPPPQEQRAIIDEFEALDVGVIELTKNETFLERRSESLRQSVLQAAFSGKLVPQDPTDEPASVLLDRIAEERAAYEAANPTRTRKPQRKSKKKQKAD